MSMVAPRKGPAGIAAPAPPPSVTVVTPPPAEPTPVPEVGFDIQFDETQFREFVELEPSGQVKSLDFGIIVPGDFASAVVAAARTKSGNETPTATQWIDAALEKARRVKPAVEASKLTADQGVCVLAVVCFMAYTAARKRGDSIDAALKVAEGIVDELAKPVTPPTLPRVDPAARTVEAPKTPAPILVAKAAAPPKKVEPAKANATAKPAPATTSGASSGRRGTTPTEVMTKVGAAAAEGGFGDSVRPPSDTALADAAKAAAAEAKRLEAAAAAKAKVEADAEAERQRVAAITARAEAERQAKQAERERLLKEASDRALFDKAEADRKKAEAKAEAEAAQIENELRLKRAAKLRGDRLRLIAAHTAARATVDGAERAQLDAEHKAALLELDAELANLGSAPRSSSKRFTAIIFTVIGLVIALGLILGGMKLLESIPASAQQPIPTATTPPVATATPGVETCAAMSASLLQYYLGNEDPTHYVDKGNTHSRNAARLSCSTTPPSVGVNTYDVTACNICITP